MGYNGFQTKGITEMDYCTVFIESDSRLGGWIVVCDRHGRIATRDTVGRAEATKSSHLVQYRVPPMDWDAVLDSRRRITAAYAEGDTTEGQRLNRETGIALGGSAESGGAVRS